MNYIDMVRADLLVDEGYRPRPYVDTMGKTSIGIGRNLTDDGLSRDEINFLFGNDVAFAESIARRLFPTFAQLTDRRKAVVINMAFNMGEDTLSEFHRTIGAITAGEYDKAADYMLQSKWAKEVGARAVRLAKAMREG